MDTKLVIINRGVSGCGKSTISKLIKNECFKEHISVDICSTDDFFMVNNIYQFDGSKLTEYHQKSIERFEKCLQSKSNIVICDNTNIRPWETEAYTDLARKHKYKILILTFNPRDIETLLDIQNSPNGHGVNTETLKRMIKDYFTFDDLLNPKIVIDRKRHLKYKWNKEIEKLEVAGLEKHFDVDQVFRISPEDFDYIKNNLKLFL